MREAPNLILSGPGISRRQSFCAHAKWYFAYFMFATSIMRLFGLLLMGTMTSEGSAQEILETIHNYAESFKYEAKKCYLVLMTGTPATSGSEGVTITKIKEKECTVTGYTRFQVTGAAGKKLKFSTSAGKGIVENEGEWEIASGLSGAKQVITFWAMVTGAAAAEGKPITWGSTTSTEIGGGATPVKVANGGYKAEFG